ncbi:MAG: hypothetical protein IPH08_03765 [Rhodocyclaceae bacterium]|nr:hypothetical protein [Rhodocyclaceae bacterium]
MDEREVGVNVGLTALWLQRLAGEEVLVDAIDKEMATGAANLLMAVYESRLALLALAEERRLRIEQLVTLAQEMEAEDAHLEGLRLRVESGACKAQVATLSVPKDVGSV